MNQPVVVLGGLFSNPHDYYPLRDSVAAWTGRRVWVVGVPAHHWLAAAAPLGWAWHLDRLDRVVREAACVSSNGKVTLVGHSLGGILGRLYLSSRPFLARAYDGAAFVDHLIMLGSPHNSRLAQRAGYWHEDQVPGAYYAPAVRYTAVGGAAVRGDPHGTPGERAAYGSYRLLLGDGTAWGDGLVPTALALLDGAEHLTLQGVMHAATYGAEWYGTPGVVRRWWHG